MNLFLSGLYRRDSSLPTYGLPSVGEFHPVKARVFSPTVLPGRQPLITAALSQTSPIGSRQSRCPPPKKGNFTAGGDFHSAPKISATFYNLSRGLSSVSDTIKSIHAVMFNISGWLLCLRRVRRRF